tara:strand:- start:264 stop:923 length:660 start_codon:yes stop_codon:yes gene_type:complete
MKKRIIISLILLLVLSTYQIQNNFRLLPNLLIKEITIENNLIVAESIINKNLSFLYQRSLFFLKEKEIEKKFQELNFIESFEIKKIYPNKIKIKVFEKKPVAILQDKKVKKYFTDKNEVINYMYPDKFDGLPIVFGDKTNFKLFYNDIKKTRFPIKEIKIFYLFESKRWDLVTKKNQTIKLPIKNYIESLNNFMNIKDKTNFEKYKTFDYRINDQLILK